jgi:hypothetical protein
MPGLVPGIHVLAADGTQDVYAIAQQLGPSERRCAQARHRRHHIVADIVAHYN